jgi:hypothetical protein
VRILDTIKNQQEGVLRGTEDCLQIRLFNRNKATALRMPVIARTTPFGSFAQFFSPLCVRNNVIIFCIPILLKGGKGMKPMYPPTVMAQRSLC